MSVYGNTLPELPAAGPLDGTELFLCNQVGLSRKVTGLQIFQGVSQGFFTNRIFSTSGNVTVSATDVGIIIRKAVAAPTTCTLPVTPSLNQFVFIKDGKGDAATNNITVNGNGNLIDGSATLIIGSNYGGIGIVWDTGAWNQLF